MLNPGTLFVLHRDMGHCLRPREWSLDHDITCTVISGEQVAFGTRGATNRYLVIGGQRLVTLEVSQANELRLKILQEPK